MLVYLYICILFILTWFTSFHHPKADHHLSRRNSRPRRWSWKENSSACSGMTCPDCESVDKSAGWNITSWLVVDLPSEKYESVKWDYCSQHIEK